jgi:hypothetical protein
MSVLESATLVELRAELLRRTRPVPAVPKPLEEVDWTKLRELLVFAVEDGWEDQYIEGNLSIMALSAALRALYGEEGYELVRERYIP